jgi:threonylcarbamoyladenosine tRNA methylthiotransferase MtaB
VRSARYPSPGGGSKSRDYRELEVALNRLYGNGYREAVLTGVNLGSYRFGDVGLSGLLEYLLRNTPDGLRIRLSSIEPDCFDDELFGILRHDRIMPHFHIPLQSGSDRVLGLMGRPYRAADFRHLAVRLRTVRRDCHLATDVIVGFPGEEEEDFRQTLTLIRSVAFGSLHVFRYSVRDGTAASRMYDSVPQAMKSDRSGILRELGKKLNYAYRKRYEEKVRFAVLETRGESRVSPRDRNCTGITDNYIRVALGPQVEKLGRQVLPVKIHTVTEDQTLGDIVCTGAPIR